VIASDAPFTLLASIADWICPSRGANAATAFPVTEVAQVCAAREEASEAQAIAKKKLRVASLECLQFTRR
jgi:hypothetical protein